MLEVRPVEIKVISSHLIFAIYHLAFAEREGVNLYHCTLNSTGHRLLENSPHRIVGRLDAQQGCERRRQVGGRA